MQHQMIVAYAWSSQGWNIQLRRNFNDWKVDTLTELSKVLEDFKGLQEGADCLCWKEDSRELIEVSVAYINR